MAAVLAVAVVVTQAVGTLAGDVVDAARARSAADAAALAGVERGRVAAEAFAEANGATLLSWRRDGGSVTVTVRVGRTTATARAASG